MAVLFPNEAEDLQCPFSQDAFALLELIKNAPIYPVLFLVTVAF
jgi:hypothetical protein